MVISREAVEKVKDAYSEEFRESKFVSIYPTVKIAKATSCDNEMLAEGLTLQMAALRSVRNAAIKACDTVKMQEKRTIGIIYTKKGG